MCRRGRSISIKRDFLIETLSRSGSICEDGALVGSTLAGSTISQQIELYVALPKSLSPKNFATGVYCHRLLLNFINRLAGRTENRTIIPNGSTQGFHIAGKRSNGRMVALAASSVAAATTTATATATATATLAAGTAALASENDPSRT
uniref:Uncharacterized protein n=1 Tax=Vespula pensylvanica TaxID=30213 RepID=A0A834P632_VESPE|nr:hypothetical protein H0235_006112 [Vespula pensylvanica]